MQKHRNRKLPYGTLLPADMPITKKIRQTTRNRKNKNLAIPAAAAEIPVNPKSAATSAIMRKIKAQRSILSPPSESNRMSQSLRVFFRLTNPKSPPNALFLHYEYNSVNHSNPSIDWSVTCVAV
jgi:hypothetical protein